MFHRPRNRWYSNTANVTSWMVTHRLSRLYLSFQGCFYYNSFDQSIKECESIPYKHSTSGPPAALWRTAAPWRPADPHPLGGSEVRCKAGLRRAESAARKNVCRVWWLRRAQLRWKKIRLLVPHICVVSSSYNQKINLVDICNISVFSSTLAAQNM